MPSCCGTLVPGAAQRECEAQRGIYISHLGCYTGDQALYRTKHCQELNMPLDHFTIVVPEAKLEDMVAWLLAANSHLGFKEFTRPVSWAVGLGEERPYFWVFGNAETKATEAICNEWRKQHIAFRTETVEQVDQWYEAAIRAGGEDNGKPGPRDYTLDYYGAFVRDPVCGINFEACTRILPNAK